jgi:chromosome segregation ATPase
VKELERKLKEQEDTVIAHVQTEATLTNKIVEITQALSHSQEREKSHSQNSDTQIAQYKEEAASQSLKIENLTKLLEDAQHKLSQDSHNSSQEIAQFKEKLQESNEKFDNLSKDHHLTLQSLQLKTEELQQLSQVNLQSAETVDGILNQVKNSHFFSANFSHEGRNATQRCSKGSIT